jgi:nickel/cobalt transporter (NicO) family protein
MWQIFIGSLFLSIIHALIPNHWIPLATISKTEKWTQKETFIATFITGFSHTLSTIFIGIIVGFVGYKLTESYTLVTKIAAPLVLLVIGTIYVIWDLKKSHSHHEHFQIEDKVQNKKSKWAILTSLSVAMFLTPCIEIEAYYFQAGTIGWMGIFIVSSVYLIVTLIVMFLLVYLALKGINKFNSHYLEHHEKRITGIVLIILAFIAYFVEF